MARQPPNHLDRETRKRKGKQSKGEAGYAKVRKGEERVRGVSMCMCVYAHAYAYVCACACVCM